MPRSSIYSPKQVFAGAFLGGPFAAVYFLRSNFQTLRQSDAARQTLWWGIAFNVAIAFIIPFLPERFPNYLLPLAYSWAARGIAASKQLTKEAIAASDEFSFASNWRVVAIAVLLLVATVTLWVAVFFVLACSGVGSPA